MLNAVLLLIDVQQARTAKTFGIMESVSMERLMIIIFILKHQILKRY